MASPILSYGIALLLGLAFVQVTLSLKIALGIGVDDTFFDGDRAQHMVGQRYFIADAWRWPLLVTRLLEGPQGVNISLTDSIPLVAIPTKLLRSILPPGYTTIIPWLGFAYIMQPIAAVFALRSAGEKRLLPAVAIAAMALSQPTLLFRIGHTALCSHFLILTAIGIYFRLVAGMRRRFLVMSLLLVVSLLIHPYLLVMVAAVLAAAPLTLLIRRQPGWLRQGLELGASLVVVAIVAGLLGYGGQTPGGGYGISSMNLLSPVFPHGSTLYRWIFGYYPNQLDATGGQYEGYQYLGVGLFILLIAAIIGTGWRGIRRSMQENSGVWIVCVVLTLFSLSTHVFVGHTSILKTHTPDILNQFRSSGRFFWPVTYFLLIGSVFAVMRSLPRGASAALLLVAAALQFADTGDFRHGVKDVGSPHPALTADELALRKLFAVHSKLTIWPTPVCGGTTNEEIAQPLVAASDTAIPVNTMYLARETNEPHCEIADTVGAPLAPGELRLFMSKGAPGAALIVPDGKEHCRRLNAYAVCTLNSAAIAGLPEQKTFPPFPVGETVAMTEPTLPAVALAGWYGPERSATWTAGHLALWAGQFDTAATEPMRLTVWGRSFTDAADGIQKVTVRVDGTQVGQWDVRGGDFQPYSVTIPAALLGAGTHVIALEIAHPVRPIDVNSRTDDRRQLGFFVHAFRLAPEATAK